MVQICIGMVRIPFERFEIGVESLESLLNGSNLESKALSPFRMVQICIRMLRIPFEWLEFASNASNPF